MSYTYISRQSEVEALLPKLMAKNAWGVDSETTSLDPYQAKLLTVQFGRSDEQYIVDARKVKLDPLRPFFESKEKKKVLHHAKYDYKILKVCTGLELENVRCTMLGEQMLTIGRKDWGFSLDAVVKERCGVDLDKSIRSSFINHQGDFTAEQMGYMANDVKYLLPTYISQVKQAFEDGLERTFNLEGDCIPCIADMELEGWFLDIPHWEKIMKDNIESQKQVKGELDEIAKPFVGENLFGNVDLNYGSPDQVCDMLEQMRVKVKIWDPKTRQEVEIPIGRGKGKFKHTGKKDLKSIRHLPVIKLLEKYRSYNVLINTFGQPYITAIHPVTKRIHGEFDQLGTETARLASRADVNFLNLPREVRFRHGFTAGPDYVIETDDYAGCELRIWAELSGDPGLLHAFKNGIDVHCYVASKLYRVEVTKKNENAKLRSPAKNLNFGIAYGMGPGTLYEDLNSQGFPIDRDETYKLYRRYEEEFRTGVDYLRDVGRLAVKQGYLANMNGRRRYWNLPDASDREKYPLGSNDPKYIGRMKGIEREGGNFVIQSVNVDITKTGMILIRDYKKKNGVRTNFSNQVYDEIVTRTHKDDTAVFHPIKQQMMRQAGEIWLKNVPVEVEGHVGATWTK